MLAIALALGASACWGSGDFLGGLTTRRASLWAVVLGSQLVGLAGAAAVITLLGRPWPGLGAMWPVLAGGAAGAVAISTFYRALAIGTMSVVAPISAMSALIPFVVGLAGGERPAAAQIAGAVVAAAGVLLVAAEPARRGETVGAPGLPGGPAVEPEVVRAATDAVGAGDDGAADAYGLPARPPAAAQDLAGRAPMRPSRRRQRQAVGLAVVAAVCIGLTLLGYDAAARHDPAWAMLAGRASSATFVGLFLLARRPRIRFTAAAWPGIIAIGLLDTGANGLFAVATTQGYLSLVAVLGTIYPAVTVLLAYLLLRERLAPRQLGACWSRWPGCRSSPRDDGETEHSLRGGRRRGALRTLAQLPCTAPAASLWTCGARSPPTGSPSCRPPASTRRRARPSSPCPGRRRAPCASRRRPAAAPWRCASPTRGRPAAPPSVTGSWPRCAACSAWTTT